MAIDPTKIGANMLAAREAKGVTRAELAMQVHLYPDLIRRYEKMEVAPGILNLIDLANALGIGLDTYVAGVSPASTSPDHFRDLTKMTALVPPNEPLTCEGCYWQTHGSFGKCIDCIREKTDHYCRPPEGKP